MVEVHFAISTYCVSFGRALQYEKEQVPKASRCTGVFWQNKIRFVLLSQSFFAESYLFS
jgi:hypothetical protein